MTMTELWGHRGSRFYPSINRFEEGIAAFVVDLRAMRVIGPTFTAFRNGRFVGGGVVLGKLDVSMKVGWRDDA